MLASLGRRYTYLGAGLKVGTPLPLPRFFVLIEIGGFLMQKPRNKGLIGKIL
jgi:hypothetical protein